MGQRKGNERTAAADGNPDDDGWRLAEEEEERWQLRSDEKVILSNLRVLEGAPPLSEYWTLFETNDGVFNAASMAQAATLIFHDQNEQIEQLGRYIHTSAPATR